MRTIGASKFRELRLSLLGTVTTEAILITKHVKAEARLVPARTESAELIGAWKGRLKTKGRLLSIGVRWNVQS